MTLTQDLVAPAAPAAAEPARPGRRVPGTLIVFGLGLAVGAVASFVSVYAGRNMDIGDSMAHLTIARRIFDSRTPGLQQLGTVWLPLPHLLLMPFIANLWLFSSGVGACILGSLCLGVAAVALHRITARLGFTPAARIVVQAVLLTNVSLLYVVTTALTDPVLIAALTSCIAGLAGWAFSARRLSGGELAVFAGLPAAAAVLSRYEGWALMASGTIFVLFVVIRRGDGWRRAARMGAAFAAAPGIATAWWLAYNFAWYRNPIEFMNGPYSSAAYNQVLIEQGQLTTKGNLGLSFGVFVQGVTDTVGVVPALLALFGLAVMTLWWGISNRALVIWLAGTSSAFMLLSLVIGQNVIINDSSLPQGAYNNRYVTLVIPWVALLIGLLVHAATRNGRFVVASVAAVAVTLVGQVWWWGTDLNGRLPVLAEAHHNHVNYAHAKEAARWLHAHYDGGGVLMDETSDRLAIAPEIGLPGRAYVNRAAGAEFNQALRNPADHVAWVFMHTRQLPNPTTEDGIDKVTKALANNARFHQQYRLVYSVDDLGIYKKRQVGT